MKKIFIISLTLLIVILFFLGIYNFAFKKSVSNNIVQSGSQVAKTEETEKQISSSEKITQISQQGVVAASFDKKDNSILYYSAQDGTYWRSAEDGRNPQQINSEKISGLKGVVWSADRNKALLTLANGDKDVFYEYEKATGKKIALKSGLDTAVWDNIGAKIFYKYFDPQTKIRTLNISNPDGSGWQKLADVKSRKITISQVPLTSLVSFWNMPSYQDETQLFTVGATGGELHLIMGGKFGADYLWAPNGSMSLISSLVSKGSNRITLGLVKMDGSYSDLNIPTIVSKCVWSQDSKTVYYALPGEIPENATMPNDYQEGKFTTKDTFWKVDIATGKRDRIIDPSEIMKIFDSSNLFLSPTEDALYFINKIDKKLYRIAI